MPALPEEGPSSARVQAAVYAAAFFTGNLFSMISVIMPLWALELGASPLVIGLIVSSRQILTVTLSIHGGALHDRYGARQVILVLGFAGAAAVGLFPVLPFVWAAILLQMVSGFAETTNWIGTQALVGRLLRGRPVYAGRMTAAARTGGFVGPSLTGLAWQGLGPAGAFGLAALWILCGVAAAWFLPRSSHEATGTALAAPGVRAGGRSDMMPRISDYRTAFRLLLLPAVALVIAATFMRQTGSGIQSSFYGVWLKESGFTAGTIGLLIGIGNGVSALSALTIGPLTRRIADHWLLILMVVLSIVAIAVTPMLDVFALLVIAISLRGVGQGLNLPLMISIAARAVGPELQGRVAALRISFNRLGGALVPLLMGALAEVIGLEAAFYAVGALGVGLIAALSLWVARVWAGGGANPGSRPIERR